MNDLAIPLFALATKLRDTPGVGFDHRLKLTPSSFQVLADEVLGIAAEVEGLADEARVRAIGRGEFDNLMVRLRSLGKRPPEHLVLAAERAITDAKLRHAISR